MARLAKKLQAQDRALAELTAEHRALQKVFDDMVGGLSGQGRGMPFYPLALSLKFKTWKPKSKNVRLGNGVTRTIGNESVVFHSNEPLMIGHNIELTVDWPASKEGVEIDLILTGQIEESRALRCTVRIKDYEFRNTPKLKEEPGRVDTVDETEEIESTAQTGPDPLDSTEI